MPDTALSGVESPQTIFQSATRGVPISGLEPNRALTVSNLKVNPAQAMFDLRATEAGTLRVFAWHGDFGMVPVWVSSCAGDTLGFSTCSPDDITAAPWGDDMGGHLLASLTQNVRTGNSKVHFKLSKQASAALRDGGSLVMSWQAGSGGVNAWYLPVGG
ncbi:hypothetical protein G7085_16185 [Tessaracoccus sp. HDW20]|uniref:hypothetical protein n=1 Tax=Tessaracoccus coleopterorum TaxID=2714950 RepID=UPI0018D31981|nr:hypothetical protein [Tessaracoccus coleopterorum]NHB85617.1 hypothetical protein [Tessaracoccus coleopterorum]